MFIEKFKKRNKAFKMVVFKLKIIFTFVIHTYKI